MMVGRQRLESDSKGAKVAKEGFLLQILRHHERKLEIQAAVCEPLGWIPHRKEREEM